MKRLAIILAMLSLVPLSCARRDYVSYTKIEPRYLYVDGLRYIEWRTPGGATCIMKLEDSSETPTVTSCSYREK